MRAAVSLDLILAFVLGASHVTGVLVPRRTSEIGNLLLARQSTDECLSECDPFTSVVGACITDACICTTANANALQTCVTCSIDLSDSAANIAEAENLITTFEDVCDGFNLPVVQIPDGSSPTVGTVFITPSVVISPSASASTSKSAIASGASTSVVIQTPSTGVVTGFPSTTATLGQSTVTDPGAALTAIAGPLTTVGPSNFQTSTQAAASAGTQSSGALSGYRGLSGVVSGAIFLMAGVLLA